MLLYLLPDCCVVKQASFYSYILLLFKVSKHIAHFICTFHCDEIPSVITSKCYGLYSVVGVAQVTI